MLTCDEAMMEAYLSCHGVSRRMTGSAGLSRRECPPRARTRDPALRPAAAPGAEGGRAEPRGEIPG